MNSRLSTMELVHRYHRHYAFGCIMISVLSVIAIGEWFGGELGIPVYAIFLVALVVLVRWLFASRSLKDSPEYLDVEYGDYCGEASNTAVKYAVMAVILIMSLITFLELWRGIFLLGSTVSRLALSIYFGGYGAIYLFLTAEANEMDPEA